MGYRDELNAANATLAALQKENDALQQEKKELATRKRYALAKLSSRGELSTDEDRLFFEHSLSRTLPKANHGKLFKSLLSLFGDGELTSNEHSFVFEGETTSVYVESTQGVTALTVSEACLLNRNIEDAGQVLLNSSVALFCWFVSFLKPMAVLFGGLAAVSLGRAVATKSGKQKQRFRNDGHQILGLLEEHLEEPKPKGG